MDIHTATEMSYKNGYEKGMEDAVKMGLAFAPSSVNNDILTMLYILHCELQCLLTANPNISKEAVDYWDKAVDEKIKYYGLNK